jgi:hypothetical protein
VLKLNISTYVIAYFDILGYSDIVNNKTIEDEMSLIYSMKEIINSINNLNKNEFQIFVYTFSDNYVIAIDITDNNYSEKCKKTLFLINSMQRIQHEIILRHGLLIRGAITKGDLHIDSNFIYGRALIKAHNMEKNAINPRIIIDNEIVGELEAFYYKVKKQPEKYTLEDIIEKNKNKTESELEPHYVYDIRPYIQFFDDDYFFIDYLTFSSQNKTDFYVRHAEIIIEGLYKNYGNEHIGKKYIWLLKYHNYGGQMNEYMIDVTDEIIDLYPGAEF